MTVMASFPDFLATFDPDSGQRGRQFEHFVKWFLKNDPEWATQVDEVWLWNDYPKQWGRDCGIDLVFKDKIGGTWAVQAKCYSPNCEITKSDVDKFLSESNRKEIDHRLLIATTDRIGANARQVLDGQEKSVVRYHLTHFDNAAVDYPDSIERLAIHTVSRHQNLALTRLKQLPMSFRAFRRLVVGNLLWLVAREKHLFVSG
jgi:predicted helicase